MSTRLVHLVVDAVEPGRLARFWAGALGWEVASEEPDEVDVCPPGFSYPDPSRCLGVRAGARAEEREEPGAPGPGHGVG